MFNIPTNCGDINLEVDAFDRLEQFQQNHLNNVSGPSETRGGITYFHKQICNWAYSIPLKFQWVLVINTKGPSHSQYLLSEIKKIETDRYESKGWQISNSATATFQDSVQNVIGCIFAQGVKIPGESINVDYAGITEGSNNGFINSPIINGRSNFEALEIGFLETNRSFIDGFLRPWSILIGHRGLIADSSPEKSIKADIYVHQLSRNGTDKNSRIRKTYVFENCAPISIASDTIDYSSSSDFPKVQVTFAYSRYYIKDS